MAVGAGLQRPALLAKGWFAADTAAGGLAAISLIGVAALLGLPSSPRPQ